jgi:hypothetical protein
MCSAGRSWNAAHFSISFLLSHGSIEQDKSSHRGESAMVDVADNPNVTLEGGVLLVDLGKKSRKQVKQLRKGTGKLLAEVHRCLQDLRTAGTVSESAQPVIMLVREKRGRLRLF